MSKRIQQLKLPIQPGIQANTIILPEWSVQKTIEDGLLHLGYLVLHTQHQYRRQTCPNCGSAFRPEGGYGADRAIPDLWIRHPSWKAGHWSGLEIKGTKTRLSPEQKILADELAIIVCRSWEDAKKALEIP